jgi:hypothetical protein
MVFGGRSFSSAIPKGRSGKNFFRGLVVDSLQPSSFSDRRHGGSLAALYGGVLALNGIVHAINKRDPLGVLGVPLCLVMLHVSFSLGLLDGLFRKGRLPSDRS